MSWSWALAPANDFFFPFLLIGKMMILPAVGNFKCPVGQCGDVHLPHCPNMILHKTHTWVLWNQIGQLFFVYAVLSTRPQNCHFHDGNPVLASFLGLKPKNEAGFFVENNIIEHSNLGKFGNAESAVGWVWAQRHCKTQQWRSAQNKVTWETFQNITTLRYYY